MQQKSLLKTENIDLRFTDEAIHEIARIASEINRTVENIGARRLHTIIEKVLEEFSYHSNKYAGTTVVVDKEHILSCMNEFREVSDLKSYIL